MSKIDELIAELCPEGVQFYKMADVLQRKKGAPVTAQSMKSLPKGDGSVRVFAGGRTLVDVDSGALAENLVISGPGIIVKSRGIIEFAFWEGLFSHKNELWSYVAKSRKLDLKFAYFYLLTKTEEFRSLARSKSVKMPQLTTPDTDEYRIPIPPLEVQREIVSILDKFTQLEAELEAELEARKSQLEAVTRSLFPDKTDPGIPYVELHEVAEVRSGWGFPPTLQGRSGLETPFYKVSDMNLPGNERAMSWANNYIDKESMSVMGVRPAPPGTVIFPKVGAAIATNKKRVLTAASGYDNNVMGLIPGEKLVPEYLYHFMRTFDLSSVASAGAVPSIRKSDMEKVLIPLPDLKSQAEIARLLSRIEDLTSSGAYGLTAEIAARHKQYEYYRNQMLTFKELETA